MELIKGIMRKHILPLLIAVAAICACSKSEQPKANYSVTATISPLEQTKALIGAVSIDNAQAYSVIWHQNEFLYIAKTEANYSITKLGKFKNPETGEGGKQQVSFDLVEPSDFFTGATTSDKYFGIFGLDFNNDYTTSGIKFSLPSEFVQTATSQGNLIVDHLPMFANVTVAEGNHLTMAFQNACAVLRLGFAGHNVEKIIVTTDKAIAGDVDITESGKTGQVILANSATAKSVTVTTEAGATAIHIPIPAGKYGSLKIHVYYYKVEEGNTVKHYEFERTNTNNGNGFTFVKNNVYETGWSDWNVQ